MDIIYYFLNHATDFERKEAKGILIFKSGSSILYINGGGVLTKDR